MNDYVGSSQSSQAEKAVLSALVFKNFLLKKPSPDRSKLKVKQGKFSITEIMRKNAESSKSQVSSLLRKITTLKRPRLKITKKLPKKPAFSSASEQDFIENLEPISESSGEKVFIDIG